MTFVKVTNSARAGKNGKTIKCPKCSHVGTVYHFAWSGLGCQGCNEMIDKLNWLMEVK